MQRIAIVFGDWSRNIGNAFFQLGGEWLLRNAVPGAEITLISDQPGYPSYWNRRGGNPENYLDMVGLLKPDYLCLVGPIFRPELERIWSDVLERIMPDTKLILLGVAAMDYRPQWIEEYRQFLRIFPPFILASRDTETYEKLGDLAGHAYDGIDLGLFLPEIYKPSYQLGQRPYCAFNFDKVPEPSISIGPAQEKSTALRHALDRQFEFNESRWTVQFPAFRTRLASRSRYFMFMEGALFRGNELSEIGEFNIIRTDHRPHPMLHRKTYRYPNVMVNDTPFPYLEVYAGASVVLTDRMHACVAAAAYGKPSMLFSESPRIRLLERVGLGNIRDQPMYLDQNVLEDERQRLTTFLRSVLD